MRNTNNDRAFADIARNAAAKAGLPGDASVIEIVRAAAVKAVLDSRAKMRPARAAVMIGYTATQLAEISKQNPDRYAAIRATAKALASDRCPLLVANLKRECVAALGEKYPTERAKQSEAVARYFAAANSGRGIVDEAAHARANDRLLEIKNLGVDVTLFAPGFNLPGLS